MKRIIWIVGLVCILTACGNDDKEAGKYLATAEQLMNAGDYNRAKSHIDSIRVLYPKAFETRKAAVKLMQQIELKEQARTLAYLDSVLIVRQAQFDSIKNNYVLEKDTAYQETGNYFSPTQTVEKNLNRTFLRAQVSERGEMTLTSIYCGQGHIHHTAVQVSSKDLFARTPDSKDIYETTDLGLKIEKADYPLGQDGDVIAFIVNHRDAPIRVEFIGDRTYKTILPKADKTAIAEVYKLAQILAAIEEIKKEQKEANLKVEFIHRKIEEDKAQAE